MWREQRLPAHDPERTSNLTYRHPLAPTELNRASQRAGEGSNGLVLIARDIRRNAGLPTIGISFKKIDGGHPSLKAMT